jgi:hypothetical protein
MRKGSRKQSLHHDPTLLEMAILGYQHTLEAIEEKIAHIRKSIGGPGAISSAVEKFTTDKPKKRRKSKMSAEGRARISAATKARWAAKRKAEKATKTPKKRAPRKRPKLSAAERTALSAGQAT